MNTHIPANDVVDLVVGLDAHWIRVDNNWRDQTNPCSGAIGFFAPLDNAVDYAIGQGLNVYMTLAYAPACGSLGDGDGNPNNNVPNATLYGSYVRQSVAHYRAKGVRHFGLWNEANLNSFFEGTAAQYVSNVLVPGFPAVADGCADAGFSDCVVMGPDLAHVGDYDVFLEDVLNAMTAEGLQFDIFTHHIYQSIFSLVFEGDSFLNALEDRRFFLSRRSLMDVLEDTDYATDGVPVFEVWITEAGMRAEPPTDPGEMADQEAEYMGIIDLQLERAWWTNTIFYEILDSMDSIDGYGITRANGDGTFFLKDAYLALRDRIAAEPALSGDGSTECSDGVDNDGDGMIDLGDPGCSSGDDDDESDDPAPPPTPEIAALPAPSVALDGDLGEWSDALFASISSPDDFVSPDTPPGDASDLSAELTALWDGGALYLAVEVTDDTHLNDQTAENMWLGDSVQVAFDVARNGGADGYDDTDDYEYGFADLGGTPTMHRWHAPTGAAAPTGSVAVTRAGSTTTYEVSLPAADLGRSSLSEGTIVGFSLLVNDDDGSGREGYVEWTSGIGQFKEPDEFGQIQLYTMAPPDAGPGTTPDGGAGGGDAGAGGGDGGPGADGGDSGGCGCRTGGRGGAGAVWLVLLALGGAVIRRRPAGSRCRS